MKALFCTAVMVTSFLSGCAQSQQQEPFHDKIVGGPCEGCEAIHESPIPFARLNHIDTLPDYFDQGAKLHLTGTVFHKDGKTPARDVVLYIYHTDQTGVYPTKGTEQGWARRHGYLRGWVKTNEQGIYSFYTLKPVGYSNGKAPAHIHITVKENGKNEYWIDDFHFADDPMLTQEQIERSQERGGSGVLQLQKKGDLLLGHRDIILGKNVPDYD